MLKTTRLEEDWLRDISEDNFNSFIKRLWIHMSVLEDKNEEYEKHYELVKLMVWAVNPTLGEQLSEHVVSEEISEKVKKGVEELENKERPLVDKRIQEMKKHGRHTVGE